MIINILKKQGLVFWRNPQQLVLLILLPVLLIIILSFSLGNFIGGESVTIDAKVALIAPGDEQEELSIFMEELKNSGLPEGAQSGIKQAAGKLNPLDILQDDIFGKENEFAELDIMDEGTNLKKLEDDGYTSVIKTDDHFISETLSHIFLDGKAPGEIEVIQLSDNDLSTAAVNNVLTIFQEQFTMTAFALQEGYDPANISNMETYFGKEKNIPNNKVIHSKEYYTIGMAVMNVLYLASAISSFAFMEKEKHIFNRIVLANVSGASYFSGIFVSGTLFGLMQLCVIFGFSWIVFGVTWPSIVVFLTISTALALAVGAFSVLLTSITYRANSESTINLFGSMIVAVLALLGGSFFPIGDFSTLIGSIGEYTPNGAAMSAYLQLLKGGSGMDIYRHVIYLLTFSAVLLAISIYYFPKRGQIQ